MVYMQALLSAASHQMTHLGDATERQRICGRLHTNQSCGVVKTRIIKGGSFFGVSLRTLAWSCGESADIGAGSQAEAHVISKSEYEHSLLHFNSNFHSTHLLPPDEARRKDCRHCILQVDAWWLARLGI